MAKRFTDTEKWKRPWYRKLPPAMRELWNYMLDSCDHAGIWVEDLELAAFILGFAIDQQEYQKHLGPKVIRIDDDKVFIPSFVQFQYSEGLSPASKPHQSIIKILQRYGIDTVTLEAAKGINTVPIPLDKGSDTVQDKDKEKDKEKEKEKEEPKISKTETTDLVDIDPVEVQHCVNAWQQTLERFKIKKKAKLDESAIAGLIQRHGFEKTELALKGMGYEQKNDQYDPAKHCRISRLLKPDIFDLCVNLGAQIPADDRECHEVEIEC